MAKNEWILKFKIGICRYWDHPSSHRKYKRVILKTWSKCDIVDKNLFVCVYYYYYCYYYYYYLFLGHFGVLFGYTILPPLRYSLQFTLTWNPLCIEWQIKIWSYNFKPFWSYVNLLLVRGGLLQYVEAWQVTAWKFSKYIVFSGPYFPAFSQNAGKYRSEKTLYLDTFHAVWGQEKQNILIFKWLTSFILKKVAYCFILGHNAWN